MNADDLVRNLIKSTIRRAICESVACLVVLIVFAGILLRTQVGTPEYFGCLVILVATGFISGVVWSHALSYELLRTFPASDTAFWRAAFHAQARLLRLVPLWYLAPLFSGMLLLSVPTNWEMILPFLFMLTIPVSVCAIVIWVNRRVAADLEANASRLES